MKVLARLGRILMVQALLLLAVCVILLLNFTAPNPTGRRYSSEAVLTVGSTGEIGTSGEQILANDLGLPNNNDVDLYAVCGLKPTIPVSRCIVQSPHIVNYRLPDFVSDKLIVDSKNARQLLISYERDRPQLREMAFGAKETNRQLWIFVRVNSYVSPEFYEMAESTGGGVVAYFAYAGYQDPVDLVAKQGLLIAILIMSVGLLLEVVSHFRPSVFSHKKPAPQPQPLPKPVARAERKTENAEDFFQRTKEKSRITIDIEDTRHDE